MASSNPNNLNLGMRCIKYMLIVINLMFVLTSILLIIVGTTIQAIFGDFSHFLDDNFLSPPTLLVAVGVIMLIVAIFGIVGAIKESTLFINLYGVLLALVFFLQLAAAISAFALQGQVSEMLQRTMFKAIKSYPDNEYVQSSVDFMQDSLDCCGVDRPDDWELANSIPNYLVHNTTLTLVPQSCCSVWSYDNGCIFFSDLGCYQRMGFVISQCAMLIATAAITVAFIQILGVVCAFMLAKTIRRTKSLRLARRWQLQQNIVNGNGNNGVTSTSEKPTYDDYTQLGKVEKNHEPVTYSANSPSLRCCGVNKPYDWYGLLELDDGGIKANDTSLIVPESCCLYFNYHSECEVYLWHGCYQRLGDILSQCAMLIATGAITVAFIQILGVVCAFMLAKSIRQTKSLRLVRRWQLQQSLGFFTGANNSFQKTIYDDYTKLEKNDIMHNEPLNCCGVNKPYDWEGILEIPNNYTNSSSKETTLVVPDSCCSIVNQNNECTEFFSNGCYQRMNFIISQSTMLIATGATAVAFVQILGVICAFMLARTIRRTKSIRLARRWQLQQSLGIINTSVNFPRTPRLNDYTQLGKVVETNNNKNNVEPITYSANSPTNM